MTKKRRTKKKKESTTTEEEEKIWSGFRSLGFDLEKKNRTHGDLVSFDMGLFLKIKWREMLEPSENSGIRGR